MAAGQWLVSMSAMGDAVDARIERTFVPMLAAHYRLRRIREADTP